MASFTKYTLLELSDPSLAYRVVTDITEDLFCGPAIEPIYVEIIQGGGPRADSFDTGLREFIKSLPALLKFESIAPFELWDALEDRNISNGIAAAISLHVHALAAYRNEVAADSEAGYLMSFKEEASKSSEDIASTTPPQGRRSEKQPAPQFTLDSATAQALIHCKAYQHLTVRHYRSIIWHESYSSFGSKLLNQLLTAYFQRLHTAIDFRVCRVRGADPRTCNLPFWLTVLASTPPHLITFTPYKEQEPGVWSLLTSKKDTPHPRYCRVQWTCHPTDCNYEISMDVLQAVKAAIATAPKVPYLASQWTDRSMPLFNQAPWPERLWKDGKFGRL